VKGPALLLAGIAFFAMLDANSKLLAGAYGVAQVVFMRYVVLLGTFAAARAARPGAGGPVRTAHPRLHLVRACAMMVSAAAFFLAFRSLPLAEGYLVFFTAPFMTLILARLVLRETVPRAAWFWSAVGFLGVLVSVAPKLGGGGPLLAYLSVLLGTASYATTLTVNRMLRHEPGVARVVLWPSLMGVALYGPLAWLTWRPAPGLDLAMLAANGLYAGAAVVCTAAAFRHADAARLAPYGYAALPVSVAFDLAIWGVRPDPWTVAGGAVVALACLMSERARVAQLRGIPSGRTWRPSAPSGGAAERTAESGKAP